MESDSSVRTAHPDDNNPDATLIMISLEMLLRSVENSESVTPSREGHRSHPVRRIRGQGWGGYMVVVRMYGRSIDSDHGRSRGPR